MEPVKDTLDIRGDWMRCWATSPPPSTTCVMTLSVSANVKMHK